MYQEDQELEQVLKSAALPAGFSPGRSQMLHDQVLQMTRAPIRPHRRLPTVGLTALLVVGATTIAVAATKTGRDLVRRVFTIGGALSDGSGWGAARYGQPFTAEEAETGKSRWEEIAAVSKAGGGRLVAVYEGEGLPGVPGAERMHVCYRVEYTLASGEKVDVGTTPNPAQRANMRLDEIEKLRDAGAGEIVSQTDSPIGLGRFILRFTLSDGQTVEVETNYPPGTRAEREAIFDEAARLKEARQFTVLNAERSPGGRVTGLLRYTLADGRTVGVVTTDIPADVISADGKYIISPSGEQTAEIQEP